MTEHPLTLQMIADTIDAYPQSVFLDEKCLSWMIPMQTEEFYRWMSDFYWMTSGKHLEYDGVVEILGFEMEPTKKECRDGVWRFVGEQRLLVEGIIDFARMFYEKGMEVT